MDKRMMLLVNPNAGKSGYKSVLGEILKIFCAGGCRPTVYFTQRPGEAPGIVAAHAADYDIVVCMGGDGTLSEVCAGLMRLPGRRPPIGYIPLGTTNDVARTLGISAKPVQAARQVLKGTPVPYDIGRFGAADFFTYVAAFGAFTKVSYGTPQESKQTLGHLAYMLEGIRQVPRLSDYHAVVEYDGGVVDDNFIFGAVTNSTSVAGLVHLGPERVNLSDGMFEMLLVRKPLDLIDLSDIVSSVLSADFSGQNVLFIKTKQVSFTFDAPVAWTRDGEDGGRHKVVSITNCHPGVEILV